MYTQTQKALSILLLTSMLLQSCGTNLMLGEQRSQMREKPQETQPAALESFPAATKPEHREGLHAASSQAPPPYTAYAAWKAQRQRARKALGLPITTAQAGLLGGAGSDDEGALEQKQSGPPPAEHKVELEDEDDDEKEEGTLQEHKEALPASPVDTSPRARRPSLVALQARMAREDIQSTEDLVKALNAARDPLEQQVLQRWLQAYIDWFSKEPVVSLTMRPATLEEYTLLAHITPSTPQNRQLLQGYFNSVLYKAQENKFQAPALIQALEYTLQQIYPQLFEGHTAPLIQLSNDLLALLTPSETLFSKATYASHRPTLYALHQALVLIKQIDPQGWLTTQPGNIYRNFKARLEAITQVIQYYPLHYQQQLVLQSLQRLEKAGESRTALRIRRLGHGFQGTFYFVKGLRSLATLDFDLDAFKAGHESLQKAFAKKRIDPDLWYEWLQALNHACLEARNDKQAYPTFRQGLQAVKDQSTCKELRFGILAQVGLLASEAPSVERRQEAMDELCSLCDAWQDDPDLLEALFEQLAILAVQGVHREQAERKLEELTMRPAREHAQARRQGLFGRSAPQRTACQVATDAWLGNQTLHEKLAALRTSSGLTAPPGRLFSEINRQVSADEATVPTAEAIAQQVIERWSGSVALAQGTMPPTAEEIAAQVAQLLPTTAGAGSPLPGTSAEELARRMVQLLPRPEATPTAEAIAQQVVALLPSTHEQPTEEVQATRVSLRAFYQQPRFARVVSFLEGAPPLATSEVQCQLMALEKVKVKEKEEEEQKEKQQAEDHLKTRHERLEIRRTPIALTDLFKARSMVEGEPEQEVQRVLLTGEAGTGKTTLTKKLAYEWALGTWGREFEAVYVLPIRDLKQSDYDNLGLRRMETLATAIANQCFEIREEEEDFRRLRLQIKEELKSPSTLVILDGLDERYGASEKLISEALGGAHKLLLLSRPYGVEAERPQVDVEMEHGGLSAAQMQAYVAQHMSREEGERLWAFLQGQPALQQLSHVPVNLQILCALWQDDAAGVQAAAQGGNLLGLYQKLTEYIWRRHTRRPGNKDLGVADRDQLFALLGEVALRGLSRGEILISAETVREVAEALSGREELPRESGLLLQAAGRRYQFPHLTFQEYFAGRQLALGVLSAEGRARQAATQYLRDHKYKPQYGVMLSFAAGEVSRREGKEGLEKLLMVLGESASEVVGLQHLFLELRCVEAWLRQGGGPLEEAYQQRFTGWVEEALRQIKRAARVYERDTTLLEVLQGTFPSLSAVLGETPAVRTALVAAARDSNEWVRSAAIEALGELAKAAPAHVEAVLRALIDAARDSEGYVRRAASAALGELAKAAPSEAVLTALVAAAGDSEGYVRRAASEALSELAKAAPSEAVLTALLAAAGDSEGYVRRAAIAALGELAKAAPAHVEAVLRALVAAAENNDWRVRSAAIAALGELAKAAPSEAVRTALIAAARDSDSNVRRAASAALGKLVSAAPHLMNEAVRTALVAAARDSDEDVRWAASAALGELAKAAPSEAVLRALVAAAENNDWSVRRAAIAALGELAKAAPSEAVLRALVAAAGDSDEDVRSAASAALGELAKAAPAHVEAVLTALLAAAEDSDSDVRRAASAALGELAKAAPSEAVLRALVAAAGDSSRYVRSAAIAALGELAKATPSEAVLRALVAAAGDSEGYVRRAASAALGELAKAAPAHVEAVLRVLVAAARDSDEDVRWAASAALGELAKAAPSEAVLRALVAAAGNNDWSVRRAAIAALGELAKAAPHLMNEAVLTALLAAAEDSDSDVRSAASAALGELAKAAPAHVEAVLTALVAAARDNDWRVRWDACAALGELAKAAPAHAEAVLTALLAAARDSHKWVRIAASVALSKLVRAAPHLMNEAVLTALLAAAGDSSGSVRSAAIAALGELAKAAPHLMNEAVRTALLAAARDSDRDVRHAALRALGELVRAAPHLMNEAVRTALLAAARDSDRDVRHAALRALGELVRAAPHLMNEEVLTALLAAAGDSDYDVSSAASAALASIAAQQLIQAGIHSRNQKIISLIVRKLYATPLVVQESRQPGYQQLVLYPSAGQPEVIGAYPQADVQRFVRQVRSAAQQKGVLGRLRGW